MTVKHRCSAKTPDMHGVPNALPCLRSGTVECDSLWYCWQHDPERVEADKKKRRARRQAMTDRVTANWRRNTRNARLAALVTLELASLLNDLAAGCDHSAWLAAKKGWAIATRIREALEVNDD